MLKGAFYLSVSQAVMVLTGFILNLYLGRTFGPEQYGVFGVINAFIMINELVLLRGIYDTMSKFVAENEESSNAIVKVMFNAIVIGSVLVGAVYFLCARQIAFLMKDPSLAEYLRVFSFIIPFSALAMVYLGAMNGLRRYGIQSWIIITCSIIRIPIVIILVLIGFSIKGVIIGLLMAGILKFVLARGYYKPAGPGMYLEGKKMLVFALQLSVVSLTTALVMNIDLLAVKVLIGNNFETGLYTSAMIIAKLPAFFIFPIITALFPIISKSISENDMQSTEVNILKALRLILIIALPLSLIIIATSDKCIVFLYGSKYLEASNALKVLLLGGIFLSIKVLMFSVIIASGRPWYIIMLGLFSLLIEVTSLVIFIHWNGIIGAAMASTVTHLFGFFISYLYVGKKFMNRFISTSMIRISLASLIVYVLASMMSFSGFSIIFHYVILLCIFFVILIAMKEINPKELYLKYL